MTQNLTKIFAVNIIFIICCLINALPIELPIALNLEVRVGIEPTQKSFAEIPFIHSGI